ncbi:uncharacterized protein LOC131883628 [Tigriopus californicus]|uniref:uncharacterized protein LOC131883628 n=1 Tax=Tigriopus californicus TaxID=6832 RepID=UPI0027DA0A44|nr:uncharacterized protein LOC131883628 [Tigriopus californicus]
MNRALIFIPLLSFLHGANAACTVQDGTTESSEQLVCTGLVDGDLPLSGFGGLYESIQITTSSITALPANAFGDAQAEKVMIQDNPELISIDKTFLGAQTDLIHRLDITNAPKLGSFDWSMLETLSDLHTFVLTGSGITTLTSDIPWQAAINYIDLSNNNGITEIPANAFKKATHLASLTMNDMNKDIALRSKALQITTTQLPHLFFTTLPDGQSVIEDDAFGDVSGGELWGFLEGQFMDFPEGAFRLLLKSHFDKYSQEFIIPKNGKTQVRDCSNCSISWLYNDAFRFGRDEYKRLVGDENVVCEGIGPVLESSDDGFNAEMEDCPVTDMPGPSENPCEGHGASGGLSDTVPDDEDCHCFYHCNSLDEVSGHDCCQPGLGYDHEIPGCNWEDQVPGCQE